MGWSHSKLGANEKAIKIAANLRSYVYTAFVDKRTGRLKRITAGCRNWKNFDEVRAHYRGENPARCEWRDEYINDRFNVAWGRELFAIRLEVREILSKLEMAVEDYRRRLRSKKS